MKVKLEESEPPKSSSNRCAGCDSPIFEQFLLQTADSTTADKPLLWHESCLRCCECAKLLTTDEGKCFERDGMIYCQNDYFKKFGVMCSSSKCGRVIHAGDWVRRAKDRVYHLACFVCDSCKRQLSTGEEFALQDSKLLCKTHYHELVDGVPVRESDASQKPKQKRIRTTFTEDQLQVLQHHFHNDSNPDGNDLERIAVMTGLSKRVTQVWFQNSRARQKKTQQVHKTRSKCSSSSVPTGRIVDIDSTSTITTQSTSTEENRHERESPDNNEYSMDLALDLQMENATLSSDAGSSTSETAAAGTSAGDISTVVTATGFDGNNSDHNAQSRLFYTTHQAPSLQHHDMGDFVHDQLVRRESLYESQYANQLFSSTLEADEDWCLA